MVIAGGEWGHNTNYVQNWFCVPIPHPVFKLSAEP